MSRRITDVQDFLAAHPGACLYEGLDGGAAGILIPAHPLPAGWSNPTTDLVWLVPNAYPQVPLDCFWIDSEARSPSNQPATNTQIQPCPLKFGGQRRWVSWHIKNWDPVRHDIEWWLTSMREGLLQATGRVP